MAFAISRRRRKKDAEGKPPAKEQLERSEMDTVLEKLEELKELMEDRSSKEFVPQGPLSDDFIDTLEKMEEMERR